MDLDFTRRAGDAAGDGARACCAPARLARRSCASWRTTRSATPTTFWNAARRARPARPACCPRSTAAPAMSMLDGVVVYEELGRALAPSPHFVSAVMSGGVLARAGDRRAEGRVAAADRRGRRDPHPGVARARRRLRPRGRAAARRGRRRRLRARRASSATCRSRRRPTALLVLARTGDGDATSTCSSSIRARRASRCTQQITIASDTPVPGRPRRRRVPAPARDRRRRRGWATWNDDDARRHHPARRAGDGRRALRARHHRAVRQGPAAVRQAARRVPGARALPRRRRRPRSTAPRPGLRGGVGHAPKGRPIDQLAPMAKLFACQTFRDVTAMAPADLRRRRLHARVRHPALLPPGQAVQLSWWDDRYLEELVAAAVLSGV